MLNIANHFYRRYFSDPDAVVLLLFILAAIGLFWLFGTMLAPAFAGIVIAYLLDWFIVRLRKLKCPHGLAVTIVYAIFLTMVLFALLGPIPLFWEQLSNLVNELPRKLIQAQNLFNQLVTYYPDYFSNSQLQNFIASLRSNAARMGQVIFSASLASIPSLIQIVIYLVLVPLLVYFFLMDKNKLLHDFRRYLPTSNKPLQKIWVEVRQQIGNYIRGKIWEIVIVWVVTYTVFLILGFKYAMLMSALVGLSVIIPYIGAVLVTIPVTILALLQWGFEAHAAYFLIAYATIITLDANVLVPILFSGAVALHPVAIILAILIFGGLFGFWGIFFAIPLASLVKAITKAWPVKD